MAGRENPRPPPLDPGQDENRLRRLQQQQGQQQPLFPQGEQNLKRQSSGGVWPGGTGEHPHDQFSPEGTLLGTNVHLGEHLGYIDGTVVPPAPTDEDPSLFDDASSFVPTVNRQNAAPAPSDQGCRPKGPFGPRYPDDRDPDGHQQPPPPGTGGHRNITWSASAGQSGNQAQSHQQTQGHNSRSHTAALSEDVEALGTQMHDTLHIRQAPKDKAPQSSALKPPSTIPAGDSGLAASDLALTLADFAARRGYDTAWWSKISDDLGIGVLGDVEYLEVDEIIFARPTSSSDRRVLISLLDQVKTISSEQHVSSIAQPVAPLVARGVTLPTEAVRTHVSDAAAAEKEQKGPSAIKLRLTDNPTDKYDSGMVRSFEVPADKYDSGTVRSFEVPVRLQESTVTRQLRGQSQGWTTVQDLEEQFSQYCKQHGRDSTVSNPSRAYLFQAFEASIALARKEPAIPYTWEKFNPIFKLWEPWIKQGSDAVESAYLDYVRNPAQASRKVSLRGQDFGVDFNTMTVLVDPVCKIRRVPCIEGSDSK